MKIPDFKISTYDFFNKFILGLVLIGVATFSFIDSIQNHMVPIMDFIQRTQLISTAFIFGFIYEVGIIINRIGSLIEEFLKAYNFIPYDDDYKKYNERKKEYPIMQTLSREYALSRNSIALFLLISIITFFRFCCYGFIPLLIMFLFYLSCKKYAHKINKLMN